MKNAYGLAALVLAGMAGAVWADEKMEFASDREFVVAIEADGEGLLEKIESRSFSLSKKQQGILDNVIADESRPSTARSWALAALLLDQDLPVPLEDLARTGEGRVRMKVRLLSEYTGSGWPEWLTDSRVTAVYLVTDDFFKGNQPSIFIGTRSRKTSPYGQAIGNETGVAIITIKAGDVSYTNSVLDSGGGP